MRPPFSETKKSEAEEKVHVGAPVLMRTLVDRGFSMAERWKGEGKGGGEQCSRRPHRRRVTYCQGTNITEMSEQSVLGSRNVCEV